MTTRDVMAAELACQRVVVEFAHLLDHREFDRAAALFTSDGVWERHGERLVGPSEIARVIRQRPATRVERHVMTTMHTAILSDTLCEVTSYVLIFRSDSAADLPLPLRTPAGVGEFQDRLTRTEHGWRFVHRRSLPVFTSPHQATGN
jgi:SnoaL-like domain